VSSSSSSSSSSSMGQHSMPDLQAGELGV
jgi:hypothetical protein